ncbi:hypothetical protein HpCHN52_06100 [Helicobacter pylori]|nr:hypothetical protein VN0366_05660 [Helicobacter pylori]GHS30146.1 hypothetical protein VN1155_10830 [Helicobacter pylori]
MNALEQSQQALKNEKAELLKEKDKLTKENTELKTENDKLNHQIIALAKEQDSLIASNKSERNCKMRMGF